MSRRNHFINVATLFAALTAYANYKIGVPHWVVAFAVLLALPLLLLSEIRRRTGR